MIKRELERNQRLSLKALRREFELDAEALADLIDELVEVQRIATQDGEILVWIGPEPSEVTPRCARQKYKSACVLISIPCQRA